jgi:hypothetical protein
MAKKHHVEQPYKFFPWDEPNPIGKYKQPIANTDPVDAGYPQKDIDKDNVMVKGRWPSDTEMKKKIEMKGAGAATKGKKFYLQNDFKGYDRK